MTRRRSVHDLRQPIPVIHDAGPSPSVPPPSSSTEDAGGPAISPEPVLPDGAAILRSPTHSPRQDGWSNATLKRDQKCSRCPTVMRKGERCLTFRERALSSYEAIHGSLYPRRYLCVDCVRAREEAKGATRGCRCSLNAAVFCDECKVEPPWRPARDVDGLAPAFKPGPTHTRPAQVIRGVK